ncbi:hypothetical protein NDU88_003616 [Pleurodeles waltl]|uniref:Uncharacterized protein n=1 Tax=Pleurodeles waltl TaxID=8319 RepID=A0AAV7W7H4_PLEWA|nr:hypothetical protein NDU88_003616 [Pleurodeles waltl]
MRAWSETNIMEGEEMEQPLMDREYGPFNPGDLEKGEVEPRTDLWAHNPYVRAKGRRGDEFAPGEWCATWETWSGKHGPSGEPPEGATEKRSIGISSLPRSQARASLPC